jgi:two-component system LytT family sensor kinase
MERESALNYKRLAWHLLFWLAYFAFVVIDDGFGHRDNSSFNFSLEVLTDFPVAVILVYINLYFLMPSFYWKRKYVCYSIGLILLLCSGGITGRFFSWWIWLPRERAADPTSTEPTNFWIITRIAKDAADTLPIVAATVFIKVMRNSFRDERKLRAIEQEKFSAEMSLLKAQINPHFFFNTLNSLYSLTLEKSDKSPDVVLKLAELMRYVLYEASASTVLLSDEIMHLNNYIAIEQMRFADRLDLSFLYSGDIEGKIIAPLLLLPFVENAFKHGIENNSRWITIDLKVTGKLLDLKVENSFDSKLLVKNEGIGLKNVRRRLELSYPQKHIITVEEDNLVFKVDLKINL